MSSHRRNIVESSVRHHLYPNLPSFLYENKAMDFCHHLYNDKYINEYYVAVTFLLLVFDSSSVRKIDRWSREIFKFFLRTVKFNIFTNQNANQYALSPRMTYMFVIRPHLELCLTVCR